MVVCLSVESFQMPSAGRSVLSSPIITSPVSWLRSLCVCCSPAVGLYHLVFLAARKQLMGTPSYMAPESILHGMYGKEVDW